MDGRPAAGEAQSTTAERFENVAVAVGDYLAWLGIGAVWLSPVSRSPMLDFGYDIADFTSIDPRFGTLDDFDRLLAGLHVPGRKVHAVE